MSLPTCPISTAGPGSPRRLGKKNLPVAPKEATSLQGSWLARPGLRFATGHSLKAWGWGERERGGKTLSGRKLKIDSSPARAPAPGQQPALEKVAQLGAGGVLLSLTWELSRC